MPARKRPARPLLMPEPIEGTIRVPCNNCGEPGDWDPLVGAVFHPYGSCDVNPALSVEWRQAVAA